MVIRLVSGSRSLADTPAGFDWCTGILRLHLTPGDILVTGYAKGPDRWSLEIAEEIGIPWYSYRPTGRIETGGRSWDWCKGHGKPPTGLDPHWVWREWFLLRDRVMVGHMEAHKNAGREVGILGFLDPKSETQGTEYTLQHAEKAGLSVNRFVFAQG
jgi:hypothetical protein